MGCYKYIAFVGAACLSLDLFPLFAEFYMVTRGLASLIAFIGVCYFMIKADEMRYGISLIICIVLIQPLFDIGLEGFMFVLAEIFVTVMLFLTGMLAYRIEAIREHEHAKRIAEIEAHGRYADRIDSRIR